MTFSTKSRTALCAVAIAVFAGPAVPVAGAQDLRMPDTHDAAEGYAPSAHGSRWQDMRSADARDGSEGYAQSARESRRQDMRSADARDVAQGHAPAAPDSGRQDMRSADARDVAQPHDLAPVAAASAPSVPSYGGMDWVSAGLGAALFGGLVLVGVIGAALLRRLRTRVVA